MAASPGNLNPGTRYRIRRGISFRYDGLKRCVRVGYYPPAALVINDVPTFFPALLKAWSTPRTLDEIKHLKLAEDCIVTDVADDLVALGLLEEMRGESRFDRHDLYFRFFGLEYGDYHSQLSSKRVGIIGTGGIGSTASMILTAAGIGSLTISDGDRVEESNLTRCLLFEEGDIGQLKVVAAEKHLLNRHSHTKISRIPEGIDGSGFIKRHFSDCDFLILSADKPHEVHSWVDDAARELNIPYLTAGYVEAFGSIGPIILPGVTGCYACAKLNGNESGADFEELNASHQAPSYGPLNTLVSSIAVNETLRYLLKLPTKSFGRQILVSSINYEMHENVFRPNPKCLCNSSSVPKSTPAHNSRDKFSSVAEHYSRERATTSLNALLLDKLLLQLVGSTSSQRILDVGCANGILSIAMASEGHLVTAIDNSDSMLRAFEASIPADLRHKITLLNVNAEALHNIGTFDRILLNLIVDHIADPAPLLRACREMLPDNGRLIVVIPHPFKDSGYWEKRLTERGWSYDRFVISNYFYEGKIEKNREDEAGNVIIRHISSYKRNLESYFKMLADARFVVRNVLEPSVTDADKVANVNMSKASRVPYFLVLECSGLPC